MVSCFWAVYRGGKIGIFTEWSECEKSIKDYDRKIYKRFETLKDAEIFRDYGEERYPTIFYGVTVGHTPGVYSSRPKAEAQVKDLTDTVSPFECFNTREEATKFVARRREISCSEVFVAPPSYPQSYFDAYRGVKAEATSAIKFEPDEKKPFLEEWRALASSQR